MRLFDNVESKDLGPAQYSEPEFAFLNRSARLETNTIRLELEKWFAHYPHSGQSQLRIRFRSEINSQHQAAFFELFLHEMLRNLGCQITLHPSVPNIAKTPDFLAETQSGDRFYIEATIATNESSAQSAAHARENDVYDVLNRVIKSSNFFLSLTIEGAPATPPPAKKMASFLNKELAELDPDQIAALYEAGKTEAIPIWHFEHEGWKIDFQPFPKKPEARSKAGVRPLGALSTGVQWVDHRTAIRDAITGKAGRYGELDLPYIIAVNALEIVDDIDVMEALFGKEQFTVTFSENSIADPLPPRMSLVPEGVWTAENGPRYTRVSGVLIATRLSAWNIPRADLRLYHNPWAARVYQSVLTRLPQAVPQENHMKKIVGESNQVIFNLQESWPEVAS